MKQDIKARWVEALRSGNYQQGHGELHSKRHDGPDQFCCLGVLCDLAVQAGVIPDPEESGGGYRYGVDADMSGACLPHAVQRWAGMDDPWGKMPGQDDLASLNDGGSTFSEIADCIEAEF